MGKRILRTSMLAALVLAVSCGAQTEEMSVTEPLEDPRVEYSYRWSADPGIDLFSRGAELVRATEEGGERAFFSGVGNSFTGYRQAIGGSLRYPDPDIMDAVSSVEPRGKAVESTNFRHITDFSASDDSVGATLCTSKLYANDRDNSLAPPLLATRIELENKGDSAGAPGVPDLHPDEQDHGAGSMPEWNIFGTWKITRYNVLMLSTPETSAGCTRWWHSQFPDLPVDPDTQRIDVPREFRAPIQPVAIQYPEWIGPTSTE